MPTEATDFFGMSDEEFAKLGPSSLGSVEGASASSSASENEDNVEEDKEKTSEENAAEGDSSHENKGDGDKSDEEEDTSSEDEDPDKSDDEQPKSPEGKKPEEGAGKEAKKTDGTDGTKKAPEAAQVAKPAAQQIVAPSSKELSQEQLASFYDQVMKPFKANGRTFNLQSPEEAIRLMQMGAGAGRFAQEMQPHRKTLRLLEKNDLLDETKISFLIDLSQKNPDAIRKLVKDAGINPLDLNMEDNADYKPVKHVVSDNEIAFNDVLKEVSVLPGGRETIQHINSTWDEKSKNVLWENPALVRIIQEQRENGLYSQITAEMDRKKTLGEIPYNTPFLDAYKIAGDALVAKKALVLPGSETNTTETTTVTQSDPNKAKTDTKRVLGTRTATPKSSVNANDKAKAAASPQASSRKAKETLNPLNMSDEDFMKQFGENRF